MWRSFVSSLPGQQVLHRHPLQPAACSSRVSFGGTLPFLCSSDSSSSQSTHPHTHSYFSRPSHVFQQVRGFARWQRLDRQRIERKWRCEEAHAVWKQPQPHYGMLNKLRLTRFGWQYRTKGFHAGQRRFHDYHFKRRRRIIRYIDREEMRVVRRACPALSLHMWNPPIDHNPNYKPARAAIGKWFG